MFCSGVGMAPRVTTMLGCTCQATSRSPCGSPSKKITSIGP
jgi:hypothetical protein